MGVFWAATLVGGVDVVIVRPGAGRARAVQRARQDRPELTQPPTLRSETPGAEPLRETLQRCHQMGEAATRNAGCLAAWDENRRRFLSPGRGN